MSMNYSVHGIISPTIALSFSNGSVACICLDNSGCFLACPVDVATLPPHFFQRAVTNTKTHLTCGSLDLLVLNRCRPHFFFFIQGFDICLHSVRRDADMCRRGALVTSYDFSNVACVFVGTRKLREWKDCMKTLKINEFF